MDSGTVYLLGIVAFGCTGDPRQTTDDAISFFAGMLDKALYLALAKNPSLLGSWKKRRIWGNGLGSTDDDNVPKQNEFND